MTNFIASLETTKKNKTKKQTFKSFHMRQLIFSNLYKIICTHAFFNEFLISDS